MDNATNLLFRFVSVRGPEPVYAFRPTDDLPPTPLLRRLHGMTIDLAKRDPKVAAALAGFAPLSLQELQASQINLIRKAISASVPPNVASLLQIAIQLVDGTATTVGDLVRSEAFEKSYIKLIDSWLLLILTKPKGPELREHLDFLRVAHLAHLAIVQPDLFEDGTASRRLRDARVSPPLGWLPVDQDAQGLARSQATRLSAKSVIGMPARKTAIATAMAEHKELVLRRETLESIQQKSVVAYATWKRASRQHSGVSGNSTPSAGAREAGPRSQPTGRAPQRGFPPPNLDKAFFKSLDGLLTPAERVLYKQVRTGLPETPTHADHDVQLAPERWAAEANRLCQQIVIWEREEREAADLPHNPPAGKERPLVRSIGWGDLIVARERLVGYAAREIAHIENVMPGESRLREHDRTRTVETVSERETLTESESQRDLETSDRSQLQSDIASTITEGYTVDFGVNTSGRYGLTQVDTSFQAGMQKNKSEARSSSQTLAKEVVSKAIERTLTRVRELRRETVTEQIRELNRHGIKNRDAGVGNQPTDVSGIYLWVEKQLEVQLRNHGSRMLIEFHIPEPALSLLGVSESTENRPRKPAPFTLSPSSVLPENYLCLTQRYGAQDVEPPPPHQIQVGYSWASNPDESADENAQETRADLIPIPNGYRPIDMTALVSTHPGSVTATDVFLALGGKVVVQLEGTNYAESGQAEGTDPGPAGPAEILFEPSTVWPGGVPIAIRAKGSYDNTVVAEATIRCVRTQEALATWQLRTWEKLRVAHEMLMQAYQTELDRQSVAAFAERPQSHSESENRRIEREELRKWAIKAMRLQPFNFDGTVIEQDGRPEINSVEGDLLARVAGFFEEAFEWPQSSYFLYPYYWARRETWQMRSTIDDVDARHAGFLRAGAARYIVPVTPGYEERVIYYLEGNGSELDRLQSPPKDHEPQNPLFQNLWLELLLEHRTDLAVGSGTLRLQKGKKEVEINSDSNWHATIRDGGRELYIGGDLYVIADVTAYKPGVLQKITLTEHYRATDDASARFAAGSTPYGPPWIEHVPTPLMILEGRRQSLQALSP